MPAPTIELIEEDGATVLVSISIDGESVRMVAEIEYNKHTLTLSRVHLEGSAANALDPGEIYRLACAAMEEMPDVESIVVLGAIRTSGARPGHRPRPSSSGAVIVVLSGWREGTQKVSATLLLQSACGMSLAEAHRVIDRVLKGVTVEVSALHDAGELAKALRALGISAHAP